MKVAQSCLTLCDPSGILQARILEWVAFPFSRGSNQDLLHCRWILYQQSYEGRKPKSLIISIVSPCICYEVNGPYTMILFFDCWKLPFHSPLSRSSRGSLIPLHFFAIRVVSSLYLGLLIFLPEILIQACVSSSLAFCMMYSAYKLNKESDNIQPWHTPFPICK